MTSQDTKDRSVRRPDVLRAVFSLIRYQPVWFAASAFAWLLFHTWPLIPGVLAKLVFDLATNNALAGANLATVLALVAVAGIARIVIIISGTYTGTRWRVVARGLMQHNMLARTLAGTSRPESVGSQVSTFRDDTHAISMLGDWVYDSLAALAFIVGGLTILVSVDATVTVFVVTPIVGVVVIAHAARNRIERARERSRSTTAEVTGTIGDLVAAVKSIQAAGKEDSVVAHLNRQGERRKQATLHDDFQAAWLDGVFANTASLGAGFTLLVAAEAMRSGTFTLGDFMLFSTYLLQVTHYTRVVGYLARTRRQAGVSLLRTADMMRDVGQDALVAHQRLQLTHAEDRPRTPVRSANEPFRELVVDRLSVRFPESGRGISEVGFTVRGERLTVVTGRVGAGKTTLLRAVLGLIQPDSGTVSWNGREIESLATFMVPPRVAYTAQRPALLSGTIQSNIELGLAPDATALRTAVHTAVLDRDLATLPDGLHTEIGVRGVRLSGGQVQRTAAARMVFHDPQVLVFDDLSSALDIETELELWDRLHDSGQTCVAVSHRRVCLERADQIIVLKDGRIEGSGRLTDLLETCREMRLLYGSEAPG